MNGAGQGSLIGPDLGPFFAEVRAPRPTSAFVCELNG